MPRIVSKTAPNFRGNTALNQTRPDVCISRVRCELRKFPSICMHRISILIGNYMFVAPVEISRTRQVHRQPRQANFTDRSTCKVCTTFSALQNTNMHVLIGEIYSDSSFPGKAKSCSLPFIFLISCALFLNFLVFTKMP